MGIYIDDKYYNFSFENFTILQFCTKIGIYIPYFCYHEKLNIAGNCRMCLVEANEALAASCSVEIINDMVINTNNKRIQYIRENILEFLLINHPLDCPICDQ